MELYRHSGRIGALGVFIASLLGFGTAAILGLLYAFLINWSPIVYLNALGTLGLGFVVGIAVGYGAVLGKMRNTYLVGALGLLSGLLAMYVAWAADAPARTNFAVPFLLSTDLIKAWMQHGYDHGFWTLGKAGREGGTVKGMPLAFIWGIESLVVVLGATLFAGKAISQRPFCEEDNCWTKEEKNVARVHAWDPSGTAISRLQAGEIQVLNELLRVEGDSRQWFTVDVAACPSCAECDYVTIKRVTQYLDSKGNPQTKEEMVVNNLGVTREESQAIRGAGRELSAEELARLTDVPEEIAEPIRLRSSLPPTAKPAESDTPRVV